METPQWRYINRNEAAMVTRNSDITFPYIDEKLWTLTEEDDMEWLKDLNPNISYDVAERLKRLGPTARIIMCNSCWMLIRALRQKYKFHNK